MLVGLLYHHGEVRRGIAGIEAVVQYCQKESSKDLKQVWFVGWKKEEYEGLLKVGHDYHGGVIIPILKYVITVLLFLNDMSGN